MPRSEPENEAGATNWATGRSGLVTGDFAAALGHLADRQEGGGAVPLRCPEIR